jgi:hypothetical protein
VLILKRCTSVHPVRSRSRRPRGRFNLMSSCILHYVLNYLSTLIMEHICAYIQPIVDESYQLTIGFVVSSLTVTRIFFLTTTGERFPI